jgi:hypothetical protein
MATASAKTGYAGPGTVSSFEVIRAEALFASTLQASDGSTADEVRRTVGETLHRLGIRGCAAYLAGEYGDHPETAAARMVWARATVRAVYGRPSTAAAAGVRPLALAG